MNAHNFVGAGFAALLSAVTASSATYSTAPPASVAPSMLLVSVARTRPSCGDDDSCWSSSPAIRSLVVAPRQPFRLGFDCEAQPIDALVRLPFLFIPTAELIRDDELTVSPPPSPTLTVDYDGHRSTQPLPVGAWAPLTLIDAEPVAWLRIEPRGDER